MHFIGMAGLPRRYYTNTAFPYFDDLTNVNVVITIFAIIAAAAHWSFYSILSTLSSTERKVPKPMGLNTLEWTAEVKHIHGNWDGPIPHVHRWAYDYSKLNKDGSDYVIAGQDYIPANGPHSGKRRRNAPLGAFKPIRHKTLSDFSERVFKYLYLLQLKTRMFGH